MPRRRSKTWDTLSPRAQKFIDDAVAKTRPLEECDDEHVARLAVLLGLRPPYLSTESERP